MGLFFKKNKTDDFLKPPIHVEPAPSETMTFDANGPARMPIEDVFKITGRGTVITGRVESGTFSVGQKITITTANGPIDTTITGIETFHAKVDFAAAGTSAGLVLADVDREAVKHGDIVTAE